MKFRPLGPGDWGYRPGLNAMEQAQRDRLKKAHKEMRKDLRKSELSFLGDVLVLTLAGYFVYWLFFS